MGTIGRTPLLSLTAIAAAVLLAFVALALPGDPAHAWDGFKEALQDPRVLVPLTALATVGILACVRAWTYRRLVYLPGPIQALSLEEAGERRPIAGDDTTDRDDASDLRLTKLDIRFRQKLMQLQLSPATATPGAKPAPSFIELLETSTIDPKQPFAAIGRMLRLVRPTHAYEVKTTLLRREKAPKYGVAMEVVILPQRRSNLRTYWKESWEIALDRAATGIAAEVVPRSRHSDRGVWCMWKGLVLDEELFDLYQHAQTMRERQRHDEALGLLYQAVRRDPGNGHLRLALGSMQEALALYLDALLTYSAIRPPVVSAGKVGRQKSSSSSAAFHARYRYTVLLGFGERLAEQWLAPPAMPRAERSRRSQELKLLRSRLRPDLIELFAGHRFSPDDLRRLCVHEELYPDLREGLEALLDERPLLEWQRSHGYEELGGKMSKREKHDSRRLRELRLHLFFQLLAEQEVDTLLESYDLRKLRKIVRAPSVTSLEMLPAWARLRADRARHLLYDEVSDQRRQLRGRMAQRSDGDMNPAHRRRLEEAAAVNLAGDRPGEWPPSPEAIQAMWSKKRFLRRTLIARLNASSEFGDHYDAACTYAVALLPAHGHESVASHDRIDALTASAVDELCRAAHVGGSTALAASWDLILSEDLDLVGLRGEPAFRRFETEWLPAADRVAVRPRQIVRLKASRSSVELCSRSARCLARVWHARAALEGPTDISEAFTWLDDEIASWELARELVAHHRHWQTRLKVINEMQRFAERNGAGPFRARHPLYIDRPLEGDAIEVDRDAGNEIHFGDLRLNTLAEVLGPRGTDLLPGFKAWRSHLSALDRAGKPLEADERRKLACNRAAAWSSLHRIFGAQDPAAIGTDKRLELTFRKVIETEFKEIREALTQAPPPARPRRFTRLPDELLASPWVDDHPPFVASVPGPASRC